MIGRGGSVRLVGDGQQLAAIGAGRRPRDIEITHGAIRLTELHRRPGWRRFRRLLDLGPSVAESSMSAAAIPA